jgi:hypothetical protein
MSIGEDKVREFVATHENVFVLDRKFHSYFLDPKNLIDVLYSVLAESGNVELPEFKTNIQLDYEKKFARKKNLNEIIPVTKHYESLESLYANVKKYVEKSKRIESLNLVDDAYQYVEKYPIKTKDCFFDNYDFKNPEWSYNKPFLYTRYNLYNQTGRPTNTFNGINFLAIPKDVHHRDCIVANNDYLVEFDFDGYHVRLISKEIGYELPKESIHEYFGKLYFDKDVLTEEEYKLSKTITFKQLYGGVMEDYRHLGFFQKMQQYIESMTLESKVTLPTGLTLNCPPDMTKIKLFNYMVQNLETKNNTEKILQLKEYLKGKKTRLVLITYDAFLFDFDKDDGKDLLLSIKSILETGGYLTKHKYGKSYFL